MRRLWPLLLLPTVAVGAGLEQRQCFPAQSFKLCLYQDAGAQGLDDASDGDDERKPPLAQAELRIYDSQGGQLSRLRVGRLSKLERTRLSDGGKPVFLLEENHGAGFGSYSGVEARPFTVGEHGLVFVQPPRRDAAKPFVMARALKSDWRETRGGFLLLSCAPDFPASGQWDGQAFRVRYGRLKLQDGRWLLTERSERGFWENEGDFPAERLFPK
ncbi:hypothetical protein CXB49_19095 [Chromobacterium sp. ATCC 53434]|uniref:hypothetical protein n=1 Tax=Chromobacterium sp. (strain ATCC 53434 / SC 14030) TaxID=2059672 RepID=UPI000C77AD95|nr:hypothetical protein [Chromobacterium sp. ATCC 53434]AUH52746.1 hypothetical protein CXB49_19095 [Chromobacterium sp. ATCC 53434]